MPRKAKRKPTKNQQTFAKQVHRIKESYRRLISQGYRFDRPLEDIVNLERPKSVRKTTLAKLAKITPASLRKFTTAISEVTGKIIPGTEAFTERRREAGKKGAKTRAIVKEAKKESAKIPTWEEQRRLQDLLDLQRAQEFQAGELIMQQLENLFDLFPTKGSNRLKKMLDREIINYGRDAVMRSIAQAPEEIIRQAQELVYYERDKESLHKGYIALHNMITGEIANLDTRKQLEFELDEISDFPEFNNED